MPKKPRIVAFDTETTGLSAWHGHQPYALSLCTDEGEQMYFEWEVCPTTRQVLYSVGPKTEYAFDLLRDPEIAKVGHNVKFDIRMLERCPLAVFVRGQIHDTMIAARTTYNMEPSLKLKPLSVKYLKYSDDDEKELHDTTVKARNIALRYNRYLAKKMGIKWEREHQDGYNWAWKVAEDIEPDMWLPAAVHRAAKEGGPFWSRVGPIPESWATVCRRYCMSDSERTMLMWAMYDAEMDRQGVRHTYDFEMRLWPVVYDMETRGMRIDREVTLRERRKMVRTIEASKRVLYEANSKPLNLRSDQQVRKLIYGVRKMPVTIRTDSGQPSTSNWALQNYIDDPVVEALFQCRMASKSIGTFMDNYLDKMVPDTVSHGEMCLHGNFNQAGTVTGRFSCSNPNMQQTAEAHSGRSIFPIQARTPFGPRRGYNWYLFDYAQLEVRIFAWMSQEPTMLGAIINDRDLHNECVDRVWGHKGNPAAVRAAIDSLDLDLPAPSCDETRELWDAYASACSSAGVDMARLSAERQAMREEFATRWLEQFDWSMGAAEKSIGKKNYRNRAKMIMFTKLYGGGAGAIATLLKTGKEEAKQLLKEYDAAFPQLLTYGRELEDHAIEYGYTTTAYGRRLWVSPQKPYTATNYTIQGTAADLLKRSMINTMAALRRSGLDAHLVLTLHDELIFEVRKEHAYKWLLRLIRDVMEDHGGVFGIPLPVDCDKAVSNWDSKVEVSIPRGESA